MRQALLAALLAAALVVVAAPSAGAAFGFKPGSVQVSSLEAGGQPETHAGAHPDTLNIGFAFTRTAGGELEANARDITVDLPAGYNGDPSATPRCGRAQIVLGICPPETQIGVATTVFAPSEEETPVPVYNVVPQQGVTAEFAMFIFLFPVRLEASVRSESDFGTRVEMSDVLQEFPLAETQITLWGVPADHQVGTSIPRRPLLTLPTRCGVPLRTDVSVRTWQHPNASLTASASSAPLTGCGSLDFSPAATVAPDATTVDTPTGLHVGIDLPQHLGADELATAQPSQAIVTLPAGLALAPSVVQGLAACSDAQAALGSAAAPACPAASRIGTAEIDTPLLADPLRGGLYVATPAPGDAFRLFLTAQGPDFAVKLVGSLRRDPATGRLVATVDDLPQLPFGRIALDFAGGPRAPFATPLACGPQTASVVLASWAGGLSAPATSTVSFGGPGGAPCPAAPSFAPTVDAGVSPPTAGASSALAVRVARGDGQQTLDRVTLALPPGLSARVGGVERCADAQAAAGACPEASRIGSATAWAGPGSAPLPISGGVYLTGPYRGAQLGLAIELPVQAGPFDLGRVVVRAALEIAPGDGRVTVTTDPLPQTLGDVALRLQRFEIDVDRPGFLLNPTSCAAARVDGVVAAGEGATAHVAAQLGLRGCRDLGFDVAGRVAPLGGTARKPGLRVSLRRSGAANLRSVAFALPRVLGLDAGAAAKACSRDEARADRCPVAARVGSASLRTPLLPGRMSGLVYAVASDRGGPPDLWAWLADDGVRVVLEGVTAVRRDGRVTSTFPSLPDVPLTAFELRLRGGARGLLRVDSLRCRLPRAQRGSARVAVRSQGGVPASQALATGPWRRCAQGQSGRRGRGSERPAATGEPRPQRG